MYSSILVFIFSIFVLNNCISQINNPDTSSILLSSPAFDYKNPQFDKSASSVNYLIKDCILAYEIWSSTSDCKIAVRFMNYNSLGTEIQLTDEGSLNINPSVAYRMDQQSMPEKNSGAVVFQSNRNGNWDIYFSYFNQNSWSTATPVANDVSDEITPSIVSYPYNNINYVITYKKGNDIFLKNFYNGVWMNEVNITSSDSFDCFSPQITKSPVGSQNEFFVAYNRKINSLVNSITYQRFFVNSDGTFNNVLTKNISQPNSQNNIRFSNGVIVCMLNYDYDTLQRKNFYSAAIKYNDYSIWNQTVNFTGNNFGGTGSSHGDITSDNPLGYSLYSWIKRENDSTKVVITKYYSSPDFSEFYVGDSTANTFVNTSTKLVFGNPYTLYRIRILWEKLINGRTALIESFRDGALTSIINENELNSENFSLSQNYPNPFNPTTVINYEIASNVKGQTSNLKLVVYNALGKEIATLVNEKQNSGSYDVEFNGAGLPSGIYFYKLEVGSFVETKRMVLIK